MRHYIGLDLGQRHDYTAIVVLGVDESATPPVYHASFIDRFREVPYPEVVRRIATLVSQAALQTVAPTVERRLPVNSREAEAWGPTLLTAPRPGALVPPELVVDATGVGVAVTDQLRAAGLRFTAITFTGGDTVHQVQGGYRVPVRDLVAVPNVLLDSGRLKLSDVPLRGTLVREMQNFVVKINPKTAHDSYGAWRENEHDDLVYALAMAAWMAERKHGPGKQTGRMF